ncbi:MAG TPA: AmmeMemoRadiSam system protein B [Candidatus Omnitrophota bacterium]|nr:AmmeMemoRadiSam system protein B [Candidatus Omnitrophota bacterium]
MIREPAVSGRFYPGTKQALREEVEKYITEGPAPKPEAIGIVSPHAGYMYSGPVAGAVLSGAALKDTCIIIGPNHTGLGKPFSIMTEGVWRLPSGDAEIDSRLAKAVLSGSSYLEEDRDAHLGEHSVEVQIPFLQALKPGVRIVPIVLAEADLQAYRRIGKEMAAAVRSAGPGGATIIASSDMTHDEPQESAKAKDSIAIKAMLGLDEKALADAVGKHGISMCGYVPACVMIAAAKELGAKGAKLIKYCTSGDASGDYGSVVGYAGFIVY